MSAGNARLARHHMPIRAMVVIGRGKGMTGIMDQISRRRLYPPDRDGRGRQRTGRGWRIGLAFYGASLLSQAARTDSTVMSVRSHSTTARRIAAVWTLLLEVAA